MNLKYAMVQAIMGEILARSDCPKEVRAAWADYDEYWGRQGGHWNHAASSESYSSLWRVLVGSLACNKILPEAFKEIHP